jgi:hypothetical protein
MFSHLRRQLGTAGLIVAIVALVAALAGGAYAASGGLSAKQKKQVKAIAKSFQGTGPKGDTGAPGPAGAPGAKGDPGAKGGTGETGPSGKSVVVTTEPKGVNCLEGGTKVEVAGEPATKKYVCNGLTGFTSTLTSKKTETGIYSVVSETGTGVFAGFALGTISFPIPLPAPVLADHIKLIVPAEVPLPATSKCENPEHAGTANFANPEAEPGYLCVFEAEKEKMGADVEFLQPGLGDTKALPTGVMVGYAPTGAEARAEGTWAVTAP